jgi:Matrixin
MSDFKRVSCLLVALAIGDWTASPRLVADDSQLPPFDSADARDSDAPDPQYADGSPGQYVLVGTQWPQPGGKGTPITLTYSFQNMFDGALKMPDGQPLPTSIIRGSIEEALHLWSSAAPINFVEVPDDGLFYSQGSTHYGQIRFRHIYINGPDPVIGDPVAKAQAYFPPGDGYPGDVEFDDSDRWQEVGTLRQPDILGAVIHEIGHTLGLGHATGIIPGQYWSYQVYDSTGQVIDHLEPKGDADMFWIFNRFSGLGTGELMPDDIAGIQAIYGAGHGSVTPLGVPEPTTLVAPAFIVIFVLANRLRPMRCHNVGSGRSLR